MYCEHKSKSSQNGLKKGHSSGDLIRNLVARPATVSSSPRHRLHLRTAHPTHYSTASVTALLPVLYTYIPSDV